MIRHPILFTLICALSLVACTTPVPRPAPQAQLVAVQPPAPPDPGPRAAAANAPAERALLFPGSGSFVKSNPVPALRSLGDGRVLLNFEGAEIREVVANILGTILKVNYTVHPAVQGTVTLRTSEPIAPGALLQTLETLLRQYGAALVKEGELFKVMPAAFAIRGSATALFLPS